MRQERDAVAKRAREALDDPLLPPEAKAHVQRMLEDLEAQEGQLQQVEQAAGAVEAQMSDAGGLTAELTNMRRKCEAALMDPSLSEEGKAEVKKMLLEVTLKQEELLGATGQATAAAMAPTATAETATAKLSAAAMRQNDLEARAMAALQDPEISEEGKVQVRTMLAQIQSHAAAVSAEEAALAEAEAEAAQMREEMASVETMKSELTDRVSAAMNDPDLSPEAKKEVMRMYAELKQASVKKAALEEQAASYGLSETQLTKGREIEMKARAALEDPNMPEEAKAQVRSMLAALKKHETELETTSAMAAQAKASLEQAVEVEEDLDEEEEEEDDDVVTKSLELEKQLMAHLGEPDIDPQTEAKIKMMLQQLRGQRMEAEALAREKEKASVLESKLRSALADPDVTEENKSKVRELLARMDNQQEGEGEETPSEDYEEDFEEEEEEEEDEEDEAPEDLDDVTSKTMMLEKQLMIALQDPELNDENRQKVTMMLAQLRAQREQVNEIQRMANAAAGQNPRGSGKLSMIEEEPEAVEGERAAAEVELTLLYVHIW